MYANRFTESSNALKSDALSRAMVRHIDDNCFSALMSSCFRIWAAEFMMGFVLRVKKSWCFELRSLGLLRVEKS